MTGMELKLRRVGARITGRRLATEMGISNTRVSAIEAQAVVSEDTAARYLAALATLTNVPSRNAA